MINTLETASPVSKRYFLDSSFLKDPEEITREYRAINETVKDIHKSGSTVNLIFSYISDLKEILGTIEKLSSGDTLDDVELFEIKSFAFISEAISNSIHPLNILIPRVESMKQVIEILDPDRSGSKSFYIFDSYSEELARIRRELNLNPGNTSLYNSSLLLEHQIRERICSELKVFGKNIRDNYLKIIKLDILISKARQIIKQKLCIPEISKEMISFKSLFNPEVEFYLLQNGKEFQRTDIDLTNGVLLITGSNMGGKSVLLKTLALSQILCHFTLGIPSERAKIMLFDSVSLLTGDDQNTKTGYSSFSSEIIRINDTICRLKKGERLLALIDEPARSTNPAEGSALAESLINILSEIGTVSVVTTHYSVTTERCRRKRVKGIIDNKMDYSLVDEQGYEVPKEAINIARVLGADNEWIENAEKIFNERKHI